MPFEISLKRADRPTWLEFHKHPEIALVDSPAIASISVEPEYRQKLTIGFVDGRTLALEDVGQECCETRYMTCDDELASLMGAQLVAIEVRDGPTTFDADEEPQEVQFLVVTTTKGSFTIANHNDHNGYYSGFELQGMLSPVDL